MDDFEGLETISHTTSPAERGNPKFRVRGMGDLLRSHEDFSFLESSWGNLSLSRDNSRVGPDAICYDGTMLVLDISLALHRSSSVLQ